MPPGLALCQVIRPANLDCELLTTRKYYKLILSQVTGLSTFEQTLSEITPAHLREVSAQSGHQIGAQMTIPYLS